MPMRRRFVLPALAAIALSASAASAQPFLEFSFSGSGETFSGDLAQVSASFVIDAADPAQDVIASTIELMAFSNSPFSPAPDAPPNASFSISSNGSLTLVCTGPVAGANTFIQLFMPGPSGAVDDPDGSIPDDPGAYTGWGAASVTAFSAAGSVSPSWNETSGFSDSCDSIAFSVREVADPNPPMPEGCSEADLAEPFGVLDFSDVLA